VPTSFARIKLRKPPYPDPVGTAAYFLIQSSHRETVFLLQAGIIRDAYNQPSDNDGDCLLTPALVRDWAVESIIQGAWMREYHQWEVATKTYFDGHHVRNGNSSVNWRKPAQGSPSTHVAKVIEQLATFSATVPAEILDALDHHRLRVNEAKHRTDYYATEDELRELFSAVAAFWDALDPQEEFTPPNADDMRAKKFIFPRPSASYEPPCDSNR